LKVDGRKLPARASRRNKRHVRGNSRRGGVTSPGPDQGDQNLRDKTGKKSSAKTDKKQKVGAGMILDGALLRKREKRD